MVICLRDDTREMLRAIRCHPATAIRAIEVDQQTIRPGRLRNRGALKQIVVNAEHHKLIRRHDPRVEALRGTAVEVLASAHMHMRSRLGAADLSR